MTYSPKAIANCFLNRGFRDKISIDPLKIQKLIFYANGYYLALKGTPLINESFEAWPKGPVVSSLYREFKDFGFSPITRLAEELDWDFAENVPVPIPDGDKALEKVIDFVWISYSKHPSSVLSAMTHQDGGPWDRANKDNVHRLRGYDIKTEYIKEYFDKLVNKHGASAAAE